MDSVHSYPFLFWPVWLWGIFTFCQQLKIQFYLSLPLLNNEYLFGWNFPILREDAALLTTLIYWVCCMYVSMYLLTTYHSTLDQSPAMPRPFYNCSFQRLLPSPRRSLQGSRLLFHNDIQVIYFLLAAVAFVTDYLLGPLIIIIIEIIIMFIIIILQCYSFNVKGYSNCY